MLDRLRLGDFASVAALEAEAAAWAQVLGDALTPVLAAARAYDFDEAHQRMQQALEAAGLVPAAGGPVQETL